MSWAASLPALGLVAAAPRASAKEPFTRIETLPDGSSRIFAMPLVLFVPAWLRPRDGKVDMVVHFHGGQHLQEANFTKSGLNAICISINLGIQAGDYGPFGKEGPAKLTRILDRALLVAELSSKVRPDRVALSAWSAGFGSVGAFLQFKAVRDRVDAVLLADGLFTAYEGDPHARKLHEAGLRGTLAFAKAAAQREKLFILTHTAIPTVGYPSVAESTAWLMAQLDLKQAGARQGAPRMSDRADGAPSYEAKVGGFLVTGYPGDSKQAHIDQITHMNETMFAPLKERWNAKRST
jgi:hypothetical protein